MNLCRIKERLYPWKQKFDMIKVAIYEDHASLLESLVILVNNQPDMKVVHDAVHCKTIEKDLELSLPEVILMDIDMPEVNGIEAVRRAKLVLPDLQIIMFTVYEDNERLFQCLQAGASGYLLKKNNADEILAAIKDVYTGGAPMSQEIARKVINAFNQPTTQSHGLSDREVELLQKLALGLPYKIIAAELGISLETVKTHLKNVYQKLHVASGTEAVAKGLRMKIIK